jgi:hypothetical protein
MTVKTVLLDVNALEREDAPTPFAVKVGTKKYRLVDPPELSVNDFLGITSNPASFLTAAVAEKDRPAFTEALLAMPAWKVNQVVKAYREHFGLPEPGESDASSGS